MQNQLQDAMLNCTWVVWVRDSKSTDWSMNSYKILCEIDTVKKFWRLMNNFDKLDFIKMQFYIMRKGIAPIWEDPNNIDGGTLMFRYNNNNISEVIPFWSDLCSMTVGETLCNTPLEITGVSLTMKEQWHIIRVWTKSPKEDLDKHMPKELIKKYKGLKLVYKKNFH